MDSSYSLLGDMLSLERRDDEVDKKGQWILDRLVAGAEVHIKDLTCLMAALSNICT